ncbi:MAG: DHHW family protein, partial [Oscillospiraceae bacterium]
GISEAYSQLNAASGIDLFPALGAKENEYIYYRTDHHWTTYGAYLAYREYCAAAALAAVDYNAKQVSDAFNGTLYSSSGVRFMKSDTVEAYESDAFAGIEIYDGEKKTFRGDIYFDEFLTAKDKYSYFLGQNRAVVTIRGNRKTEKKLLIFKDSYAHCFAPMLLEHYDE